jgi:hypothetical protein
MIFVIGLGNIGLSYPEMMLMADQAGMDARRLAGILHERAVLVG